MKPQGLLLVLSGPSGAGKGTICQMLREKLPDLAYSVSVTTRQARNGEVDGVNYFFKSVEEVKQMISEGELLEYAEVYGNYYGTPRSYVMELMEYLCLSYHRHLMNYARAFINAGRTAKTLLNAV